VRKSGVPDRLPTGRLSNPASEAEASLSMGAYSTSARSPQSIQSTRSSGIGFSPLTSDVIHDVIQLDINTAVVKDAVFSGQAASENLRMVAYELRPSTSRHVVSIHGELCNKRRIGSSLINRIYSENPAVSPKRSYRRNSAFSLKEAIKEIQLFSQKKISKITYNI